MITLTEALAAKQAQENNNVISPEEVSTLLANVKGTTFATIASVTKVTTAAQYKNENIVKVTIASVQLFNNIQDYKNVYENAVKRSAAKLSTNEQQVVDNFAAQDNYFEHTSCFSVTKHKAKDEFYLFAIYNKAESVYLHNNKIVDKQYVAQFLTKSAAEKLFDNSNIVYNVTHDIEHTVQVRNVKLSSIVSIVAQKQVLLV